MFKAINSKIFTLNSSLSHLQNFREIHKYLKQEQQQKQKAKQQQKQLI